VEAEIWNPGSQEPEQKNDLNRCCLLSLAFSCQS
jgi:hypothetical protein